MKFSLDWLRTHMELPETAVQVGEQLASLGFPADSIEPWGADFCLDVEIPANRPDCMCHRGLVRELAARLNRKLRPSPGEPEVRGEPISNLASVSIREPELCPRYSALVLTGVKIGPSPDWLEDRLASIGQRPVNNVVDITNFVLHEMGQPLHAFDLDRLTGHEIIIRRATANEIIKTLDNEVRTLRESDLVIADASKPVALAGLMGGAASEINPDTTRVFLESACFAPVSIRRTSRALGLHTEASHRFERGSDRALTLEAARRAAHLILETAGGQLAAGCLDIEPLARQPRMLQLSLKRAGVLLGMPLQRELVTASLTALGFEAKVQEDVQEPTLKVTVPPWRVDIHREEDLVEEIVRMQGYETIPSTIPGFITSSTGGPRPAAGLDRSRNFMAAAGYMESINFPLSRRSSQEPFLGVFPSSHPPVLLDNPLVDQMDTLRVSLLPGLLNGLVQNQSRHALDLKLFEVGRVYRERPPSTMKTRTADSRGRGLPEERSSLAAVACGPAIPGHWSARPRPLLFSHTKGLIESFFRRVAGCPVAVEPPSAAEVLPFMVGAEQGLILQNQLRCGVLGQLNPEIAHRLDLKGKVYMFELDLGLIGPIPPAVTYKPLPRQPAARRDLAVMVADDIPYVRLKTIVMQEAGPLLEAVHLFDRYQGDSIPAGKVSLALRLTFRSPSRTLTTVEVQEVQDRVVARLQADLGAVLRES